MAAPVINAFTLSKSVMTSGETITARIDATDPDARPAALKGIVTDNQGNNVHVTGNVMLSDPLTYELQDTDAVGFTIVQDANDPALFHVTAP